MPEMRGTPCVVRFTIEYVKWLPEEWEDHTREYYMGETCAGNLINDLSGMLESYDDLPPECYGADGSQLQGPACFCDSGKGEFVRKATAEDMKRLPVVGGIQKAVAWNA